MIDFNELPMSHDLKNIIDHKGETLESKFRLSYGIIFNLLLSREISVYFDFVFELYISGYGRYEKKFCRT